MKTFKVLADFDTTNCIGTITVDKETEDKLATGDYILSAGYTASNDGNELICLSVIHKRKWLEK